jgi:hypothetical protein
MANDESTSKKIEDRTSTNIKKLDPVIRPRRRDDENDWTDRSIDEDRQSDSEKKDRLDNSDKEE